jgi:hypothetical protein
MKQTEKYQKNLKSMVMGVWLRLIVYTVTKNLPPEDEETGIKDIAQIRVHPEIFRICPD